MISYATHWYLFININFDAIIIALDPLNTAKNYEHIIKQSC